MTIPRNLAAYAWVGIGIIPRFRIGPASEGARL